MPSSPDSFLPLAFEKMGLTDRQLLIWPFNLRHRSSLAPGDVSLENDNEAEVFKRFSFGLLNDSQAQFVLVAEGVAKEFIFNNNPQLSAEFKLSLRSFGIKARLQTRATKVQRVFLIIPDPETLSSMGTSALANVLHILCEWLAF